MKWLWWPKIPILIAALSRITYGQNCFGGIESFEKTTGAAFGPSMGTSVLLQQQDQALTRDCINLCKQQSQCLAFSLDYAGFRCSAYSVNSVGRRDVLETRLNNNFFEKTCFHGVQKSLFENLCGDRLWAFERVKDAFLNGYVEKEAQNVQTKEECERLCLTEINFTCRSADYDEIMRVCRMSKEDRRSQPQAFREVVASNRDYLENQCAASAPTSCRYDIRPGLSVISMDALQFASSSDDCQVQCDSETSFNCRAFTYSSNRCFLSGDDSVSLGPVVLPERPGSTYGEKKCVIEQCTGGAFTYEKMTGFVLRSAVQNSIIVSNPGSLGSTLECQEFCQRDGLDCPAFSVNYQNMRCDKLDRNSQGRTQDLIPRDGENYFEKICLRGPVATSCKNKAWAFERVLGHELEAQLYDRSVPFVQSRRDCEELCLEERSFICRSALYNDDTTECKLSREDRRTLPSFYRRTNNMKVNYLENQCLPVLTSCPYEETADSYPTYTDHIQMVGITSTEVCEQFCTNYRDFNCRSYAYYSSNGQCFVSGDDRASGGSGAVQARPGLIYNERKCPAVTPPTELPTTPTTETPPPSRQCSPGEVVMLEKTVGYQHLDTISPLYRGNPDLPGIISECRRMCELNYECRGFTLDYLKQECFSGIETSTTKPKELIPAENKAYFEGICLPFYLGCSKMWMFDRYADKELRGIQARDIVRLVTRSDCERRCLEERRFVCRSANYYRYNQECRLFAEERTVPLTQLSYASGVDYLENQCNVGTATCPYRLPERDMFMVYTSKAIPGITNFELCRQQCMKELDFNCRSYTYIEQGGLNDLCFLSGESRQTGQGKAIRYRLRAIYEETECRGQPPPPPPTPPTPMTPNPGTLSPPPSVVTLPPLTSPTPAHCTFDQFTYEKAVGYNVRFGRKERVPTRGSVGVVTECQTNCQRLGDRCKGFLIEYSRYQQLCFWIDAYSSGLDNTISPAQDTAYFEKICLSGQTCGKLWTFDRVPGYDFHEVPELEIPGIARRVDCEDLCLRHHPPCKSATYDTFRRICRLYAENRRTRPNSFARDSPEMEYLENQCAVEPSSCEYRNIPDRFFPYIDRLSRAYSLTDCQRQCDVEDKFACRSLNYETALRDCALSSDDITSVQVGLEALRPRPNSMYSEKGNCEQVSVQCNQQDMLLTVNFGSPFHGRVYAKGNPTQCYIVGTGQTTLLFAISLGSLCGTVVESSGRYANEVVIQQHPVIVTNSDKTIKVVCSFETLDRTVTLGALFPGASPGVDVTTRFQVPVTAIVTNTAPPPNVVMRVLDRTGRDAGIVGLGDELMLRIELRDQTSSLAIFARNLYARSKNGESLFLIDSTGCPTDPTIFPALSLDARDRKSLFANFRAFRFPSTGLVNFEVQIRFCQEHCKPVRCSNNVESYGRKKRDLEAASSGFENKTHPAFWSTSPSSHKDTSTFSKDYASSPYRASIPVSTQSSLSDVQNVSSAGIRFREPDSPHRNFSDLYGNADGSSVIVRHRPHINTHFGHSVSPSTSPSTKTSPSAFPPEYRPSPATPESRRVWPEVHAKLNQTSSSGNNFSAVNERPGVVNMPIPVNNNRWHYNPEMRNNQFPFNDRRTSGPINDHSITASRNVTSQRDPRAKINYQVPNIVPVSPTSRNAYYNSILHSKRNTYHANNFAPNSIAPNNNQRLSGNSNQFHPYGSKAHPPNHESPPVQQQVNQQRARKQSHGQDRYPNYQFSPYAARHPGSGQESYHHHAWPRPADANKAPDQKAVTGGHSLNQDFPPGSVPSSMFTTPELVVSTMVPVPDEVPLSLAIMVGDDSGIDVSWDSKSNAVSDLHSSTSNLVCTTVTTIAAMAVTLSLVHVGGIAGAYCCYRWHRKSKRKKVIQESLRIPRPAPRAATIAVAHSEEEIYAKPEVTFRNIYGSYESPP